MDAENLPDYEERIVRYIRTPEVMPRCFQLGKLYRFDAFILRDRDFLVYGTIDNDNETVKIPKQAIGTVVGTAISDRYSENFVIFLVHEYKTGNAVEVRVHDTASVLKNYTLVD